MTTSDFPPAAASVLSHDTLRERILTGGGGIGNVRGSLSKVASRYAEFLRSLQSSSPSPAAAAAEPTIPSAIDRAAACHALNTELQLFDLEINKLFLSSKACDGDSSRHDATLVKLESSISSTRTDIQHLTSTLIRERQIKHNLEEYNALAKLGNSQRSPPICVTKFELDNVQGEIVRIREEIEEAQLELMVREKQLRVFMASLGDLKATLVEEKELQKIKQGLDRDGLEVTKKRKRVNADAGIDSDSGSDDCDAGAL